MRRRDTRRRGEARRVRRLFERRRRELRCFLFAVSFRRERRRRRFGAAPPRASARRRRRAATADFRIDSLRRLPPLRRFRDTRRRFGPARRALRVRQPLRAPADVPEFRRRRLRRRGLAFRAFAFRRRRVRFGALATLLRALRRFLRLGATALRLADLRRFTRRLARRATGLRAALFLRRVFRAMIAFLVAVEAAFLRRDFFLAFDFFMRSANRFESKGAYSYFGTALRGDRCALAYSNAFLRRERSEADMLFAL